MGKREIRQLALNRETVRNLTQSEMNSVEGGIRAIRITVENKVSQCLICDPISDLCETALCM